MFIKLVASDGDTIFVKAKLIVMMFRKSDGFTHVQISKDSPTGYSVTETPEQIMEMIKNA